MFKGKKDEVAWRGMDAIKNKKKARTNVYSFILTSDHHCTPDARPLPLNFYLDARNILDMSLHVFPISVNLQRSITSIIFDIIKLHYSLISRGHFTINNHYLSILVFSNLLTIDILGQLQSNSMNTLTEYPTKFVR